MTTDRDLLTWAAKAAGIDLADRHEVWNPIADDGDALRLAVKLRLLWDEMELFDLHFEPDSNDPLAATRRAIVCAAAEIGRAMP